jgi:hypothetical protein
MVTHPNDSTLHSHCHDSLEPHILQGTLPKYATQVKSKIEFRTAAVHEY